MKLLHFNSPEMARDITPSAALACWGWIAGPLIYASVLGLLIALALGLIASARAGVWIGVPVFLALNGYMFWRGRSARLNWVIAGCADKIYVRLFVKRGKARNDFHEPDVVMLEASEVASMSAQTVEVFLYGPKPTIIEKLVIEPAQAVVEDYPDYISSQPCCGAGCGRPSSDRQALVTNEDGRLTMEWKWCRPTLPVFLQEVARKCPSIAIAPEKRSELDLNGIWHGTWGKPDAEQRGMLIEAKRLGFGCECAGLLSRYMYKRMSFREAGAYLAEIEREEAGTEHSGVPSLPASTPLKELETE